MSLPLVCFAIHGYSSLNTNNSTAWSALATPLFCMPTFREVTPATMNYASVVLAAVVVISTIWYFVWGKKNYEGPPTHEDAVLEARRASMASR
jgi:hypothetical protein